jgi:hypothetical protein
LSKRGVNLVLNVFLLNKLFRNCSPDVLQELEQAG